MKSIEIKFYILRNNKRIFETRIEAPSFQCTYDSYQDLLTEANYKRKDFDILNFEITNINF